MTLRLVTVVKLADDRNSRFRFILENTRDSRAVTIDRNLIVEA